ncbi:MAG: PEP-CTERM sorting domain-containing protein [Acidobacteria bacterium]|nr:PEP-CTERM sorting domain-containing protein [Acidobacteriota bacterium]
MRLVFLAVSFALGLSAGPVLQVGTATRQFGYLDVATGGFTLAGITAATPVGLGQAVAGDPFFVDDVSDLHRVDPATAALTNVGPTGLGLSIAAGLAPGILFGVDYANNLYSINTATGNATLVGATGLALIALTDTFYNALAGDGANLYYIFELSGSTNIASSLYLLNTASGAATLVGFTGASDIEGAGFSNGVLYAFTGAGGIRTVDLASGASTQTGTYAAPGIGSVWAATQAVPEPGPLWLLSVGLGALAFLRRR